MDYTTNSIPVLSKLLGATATQAAELIYKKYQDQGFCIVNYLYFANAMHYRVFEKQRSETEIEYYKALLEGDFLLPDGIALEIFYKCAKMNNKNLKSTLTNLNGTDFLPKFLQYLKENQPNKKIQIVFYGAKEEDTKSIDEYFTKNGYTVIYGQDGYKDFNRDAIKERKADSETIKIMLVGRGTPRQEIWTKKNRVMIEKHKLIVMNQGGTFEFLIGKEKRAPKRMVKARVLETFFIIINSPKKNIRKFLYMFGILRFIFKKMVGVITKN